MTNPDDPKDPKDQAPRDQAPKTPGPKDPGFKPRKQSVEAQKQFGPQKGKGSNQFSQRPIFRGGPRGR